MALAVPPVGVFARLIDLTLSGVRVHGRVELEDAVSSPRCPCLQFLSIRDVRGLDSLTVDSESLKILKLKKLLGVRQITVATPVLKDLTVLDCFASDQNQPVVDISAPQLTQLKWLDAYDPSSVHLSSIEHLQTLNIFYSVFGQHGLAHNRACLMLLPLFKTVEYLVLQLVYLQELENLQYLMEDVTTLPDVAYLRLAVTAKGHAFGASVFHVLRICPGIQQLVLVLSSPSDLKEPSECASGCICDQPTNWKTEKISLNHLRELEIEGFRASEHEVAFLKRLRSCVPALKMITLTFSRSVTESKAMEFFKMFQGFSRPGLCMKFYIYQNFRKV